MDNETLELIQEQIGYQFKNEDLLVQAFTRRSYANENGGEDNEVLEFIGDTALDFVVVKILTERYGYFASECDDYDSEEEYNEFISERDEGQLTELKKNLVKRETLAARIDEFGFADYLIMGKGDEVNNANHEASVKEDLFEAIIGAVTLDSSWDNEKMQEVVDIMLNPDEYLDAQDNDEKEENYVSLIQEWVSKKYKCVPRYIFIPENEVWQMRYDYDTIEDYNYHGYDEKHVCVLKLGSFDKKFMSWGHSKKKARLNACVLAYEYLREHNLFYLPIDEIGEPDVSKSINQLQELHQKKYIGEPWYDFSETYDDNGNPIWHCECHVSGRDTYWWRDCSSKKQGKKLVAYDMLCDIFGWEDDDEA